MAEPTEPEAPERPEPVEEPEAPPPVSAVQAVARVIAGMSAVGKDQVNTQQNFKYRGIDDVLAALKPELGKHGVVIVPHVEERITEQRATRGGGILFVVHLRVRWRIYGPAGDYLEAVTWGEGTDSGDKATNKAQTGAFKYMLFEVFAVAGPQGESDADGTHPGDATDPKAWYGDNGWRGPDEHDQAVRTLKDHLAQLPEPARLTFKAWREGLRIDLNQALTKSEWQACEDKRKELAAASPEPPKAPVPDGADVVVNKAGEVVGRRGDPAGVEEVDGKLVCAFCKGNPCECEAANEASAPSSDAPSDKDEHEAGTDGAHPPCAFCGSTRTRKAEVGGKIRCMNATDCRRRAEEQKAKAAAGG